MNQRGLEAKGVTYGHPGASTPLFAGIDLHIPPGSLNLLLGPNGTGKSTLIRLLCGLLEPEEGQILLNGDDLSRMRGVERGKKIALVPQQAPGDTGFSVRDMVAMARSPHFGTLPFESAHDRQVLDQTLATFSLETMQDRDFDDCSGGERERVMLARAVAQEPAFLLLDEPTSNQDPRQQNLVLEHLHREARQNGRGILMVTHDWNLAAASPTPVHVLMDGQLLCGTMDELLQNTRITEFLGEEITVTRTESGRPVFLPAWTSTSA